MKKLICLLSILALTGCNSPMAINEKQIALFAGLCNNHGGMLSYKPEGKFTSGKVWCKDKASFEIFMGEVK